MQKEFGIVPKIKVSDGSRWKQNGRWKQSYHIVVSNLAFASNHGAMKRFVEDFIKENDTNPLFWWYSENRKLKSFIDESVYTKNRCLRTPLSHKGDDPTKTKLQPIERIGDSNVWEPRPLSSAEEILQHLVTYIPDDLRQSIIPDSENATAPNSQRRASGVSRGQPPRPAPSEQYAYIIPQVQEMINTAGGSGCVASCIKEESDSGPMMIICKNDGPRTCLVTKDEVHQKNNAYIVVCPDGTVLYNCHANDCKGSHKILGKLREPESSDDGEAPDSDVTTPEDESSIDDAMYDDGAPTNSIVNLHDDGMAVEGDTENITSSLGKRTAASNSVGDDALVENDRKKVCTGRAANEAQTDVSFRSLKSGTVDLSGVERVLTGHPPSEGIELMARGHRFQPAAGSDAEAGTETQTDVISTSNDPRPHEYRTTLYLKGFLEANGVVFSDQKRLEALAMTVTASLSKLEDAQLLLQSMCASNVDEMSVKSAFEKVEKMCIANDPAYALAVLQQLYVSANPDSKKHEYGSYEEVKEDTEKIFMKIECPYAFVQVSRSDSRDFSVVREDAVRGVTRSKSHYKWMPEKKPKDADDDWVPASWLPAKCEFTRDWMRDESIKTCEKIDFDPSKPYGPSPGEHSIFNTWTCFDAQSFARVSDEESAQAFKNYRDFAVDLMGQKIADFWLDWLAVIFQYPSQKTKVAWLIQGEMGVGKTYLVEVPRMLMGSIASFQTGRPNEDLFDRFSPGFKRRTLVLVMSSLSPSYL
jgi:hypothetical protein